MGIEKKLQLTPPQAALQAELVAELRCNQLQCIPDADAKTEASAKSVGRR
jgi:hypothetical protein